MVMRTTVLYPPMEPPTDWTAQAAWEIDPVSGSDSAAGTPADPIRTRGEFYRRMADTTLTQSITVTVNSSLNSGDTFISKINSSIDNTGVFDGYAINWVGVPTALFTGAITAYTARNGATAQPTLMTIASLPVSWTASGLIDKIIEYDNGAGGFIRATVVADMGAKQAWISPPINQDNAHGQVFTNGTTINVYEMPSLGVVVMSDENATYKYFAATRWSIFSGRSFCTNCTGPVSQFGGLFSWTNCHDAAGNVTVSDGATSVYSGKNRIVCGGGSVKIKGHACVTNRGLQCESGLISTGGQQTFPSNSSDIEYISTSASGSCVYLPENQGGRVFCGGYVYGTSVSTYVVECHGRDATATFTRMPAITGATLVRFGIAGTTPAIADIATMELNDDYNNRVIGPYGPAP